MPEATQGRNELHRARTQTKFRPRGLAAGVGHSRSQCEAGRTAGGPPTAAGDARTHPRNAGKHRPAGHKVPGSEARESSTTREKWPKSACMCASARVETGGTPFGSSPGTPIQEESECRWLTVRWKRV